MLEKLKSIADKVESLQQQLYDPSITADHKKMIALQREISSLSDGYELYKHLKKYTDQKNEAKELIESETDAEMIDMAKAELEEAETELAGMDEKIKLALLPKDPNDERNIYLEVRQAA